MLQHWFKETKLYHYLSTPNTPLTPTHQIPLPKQEKEMDICGGGEGNENAFSIKWQILLQHHHHNPSTNINNVYWGLILGHVLCYMFLILTILIPTIKDKVAKVQRR